MHIICIDGGGTKTLFELFSISGELIDKFENSTCHFMQKDYEQIECILGEGIKYLIAKNKIDDFFISAGLAGYEYNIEVKNRIRSFFELISKNKYFITSDAHIAMIGALDNKNGIMVISGTGSVAFSNVNGKITRCGGWGYHIGDEGSGYWIGKNMLSIFSKQADGRLKKGSLYTLVMQYYQLSNPLDIITKINGNRTEVAKLSLLVFEAAILKDQSCILLIEELVSELASLCNTLDYGAKEITVSYIGGVFKAKEQFVLNLQSKLKQNMLLKEPVGDSCYGAYLLAIQKLK